MDDDEVVGTFDSSGAFMPFKVVLWYNLLWYNLLWYNLVWYNLLSFYIVCLCHGSHLIEVYFLPGSTF